MDNEEKIDRDENKGPVTEPEEKTGAEEEKRDAPEEDTDPGIQGNMRQMEVYVCTTI